MCCIVTSSLSLSNRQTQGQKSCPLEVISGSCREDKTRKHVLTILLVTLFYKHNLKYEYVFKVILVTHTVFKVMKNVFRFFKKCVIS